KALQHTHVQSLAKAPGAGEKVHFTPVPQKVCNKSCLVDIIEVIGPQFFKTVDANGELLPHLVHAPFSPVRSRIYFQDHFTMKPPGSQDRTEFTFLIRLKAAQQAPERPIYRSSHLTGAVECHFDAAGVSS